MRNLLFVCAGLVVVLGVVSGKLWQEVRADRQVIADLQAQVGMSKGADSGSAQAQLLQPANETKAIPEVAVRALEAMPVSATAQAAPVPMSASANRAVVAAVQDALRAEVMAQSEQTATARVLAWRDRLAIAGQTLTAPQLQALNTAAIAELRREAAESLEIDSRNVGPINPEAVAQMREATIDRQNETNLRILKAVASQMTVEQVGALRTMFEKGDAQRREAARADREKNANIGN